jgi:hypothetical protein
MECDMVTIDKRFDPLVDRRPGDVDKRLAIAVAWRAYNEDVRARVLEAMAHAAIETLPDNEGIIVRATAYKVGPDAQGPTVQMLFTAYEDVRPLVHDIAAWITIGAFARLAIRRVRAALRQLISEQGAEINGYGIYLGDEVVVSQPLVQGLCVKHYTETQSGPDQIMSMDISSRSPYESIVWAGSPDSSILYTVRIWTGRTSFVYLVDGRGKPVEHFSIKERTFTKLAMPQWDVE